MKHIELARDLFSKNFNCAQTVISTFCEDYGLPREAALKIAGGFGGGLRSGEVCGTVSGAVMVIGLKCGLSKTWDSDTKELCNSETAEFIRRFKEVPGSCTCRDILGIDISIDNNRLKAQEMNLFNTVCVDMVTRAVEILEDMGY